MILEELVGKLDWHGSTAQLNRLLYLCEHYELYNARQDFLRSLIFKFIRECEWSSALNWALITDLKDLQSQVARKVLLNVSSERIGQMRVFDALSEQFIASPELIILYKFYLFKKHLTNGELRLATGLLHELFVDNYCPLEFHAILFDEMIKLLAISHSNGNVVFGDANASTLDRDAIMDMFRTLSMFQIRRKMITNTNSQNYDKIVGDTSASGLQTRVEDQITTLRPMLTSALAASTCMHNS